MGNEVVTVELIANPQVRREMSVNSLHYNSLKWRKVGEQAKSEEVKKKAVKAAVVEKAETPFVQVEEIQEEPSGVISGLRKQYEGLAGKKADQRWSIKRLNAEIKTFEA